jgi:hypothetical protein
MRLVTATVILLVLFSASVNAEDPVPLVSSVSMIELLANPPKFDGKVVMVKGFLRLEFEGNGLYLHKEDFDQSLTENALWVNVGNISPETARSVSDKYVLLVGKFDAHGHGHMGLFGGEIGSVSRLERRPSRAELEKMTGRASSPK